MQTLGYMDGYLRCRLRRRAEPEPRRRRFADALARRARVIATPLVIVSSSARTCRPGNGTDAGAGPRCTDNTVLLGAGDAGRCCSSSSTSIYAIVVFRAADWRRRCEGPADPRRRTASQTAWIVDDLGRSSSFLAVYGTVRLERDGAGGGQRPDPAREAGGHRSSRCR